MRTQKQKQQYELKTNILVKVIQRVSDYASLQPSGYDRRDISDDEIKRMSNNFNDIFSAKELVILANEFGVFVDNSSYIQKPYVILTSDYVSMPKSEVYEYIAHHYPEITREEFDAILDTHNIEGIEVDDDEINYYPDSYLYLGCTEREAKRFLKQHYELINSANNYELIDAE